MQKIFFEILLNLDILFHGSMYGIIVAFFPKIMKEKGVSFFAIGIIFAFLFNWEFFRRINYR